MGHARTIAVHVSRAALSGRGRGTRGAAAPPAAGAIRGIAPAAVPPGLTSPRELARRCPGRPRARDRPRAETAGHRARHGPGRRGRRRRRSSVTIALTVVGCPLRSSFEDQVREHVGALPGVSSMPSVRRDDTGRAGQADDEASRRHRAARAIQLPATTRVLAVASGKGGVGKSSLTVNIAAALAAAGQRGRRPRRGHLRALGSVHARREAAAGRGRPDDRAAGRPRPEADVDRLLPRRQPAGDVARADAASRARAVPAGRALGRPRRARSSTCRPAPATSRSRSASCCRGPRRSS